MPVQELFDRQLFVTAHEALVHLGKLSADEIVLIHAAASGVGSRNIPVAVDPADRPTTKPCCCPMLPRSYCRSSCNIVGNTTPAGPITNISAPPCNSTSFRFT